jgi:hypothetical protein
LSDNSEVFARAFEVYSHHKAQDLINRGELGHEALHNFSPDLMKQHFKYSDAYQEMNKTNEDFNNKIRDALISKNPEKVKELKDQQNEHKSNMQAFKDTYEGDLKNDESIQKINSLMDQYLKLEPIKKALNVLNR